MFDKLDLASSFSSVEFRKASTCGTGALYKPGPDDEFSFIGISHCWESREHPDPFGYQPLERSKYTVLLRWFVFLWS